MKPPDPKGKGLDHPKRGNDRASQATRRRRFPRVEELGRPAPLLKTAQNRAIQYPSSTEPASTSRDARERSHVEENEIQVLRAHIENLVAEHRRTIEMMQTAHEELAEDKILADREITRLRRSVAALGRQLQEARGQEPHAESIARLLEHWCKTHRKRENVNIESGGDRWERVRKWRKLYPEQDIADAITGILQPEWAWWVRNGKADIEHILGKQKRFEDFRDTGARARKGEQPVSPANVVDIRRDTPVDIPPSEVAETPTSRVLAAAHQGLENGAGPGNVLPGSDGDSWACACPAHTDTGRALSIVRGGHGRVLLTCNEDCDLDDILDAWGLHLPDLWRGAEHDQDARDYRPVLLRPEHVHELVAIGEHTKSPETVSMIRRTLNAWLPRPAPVTQLDADARTGARSSRRNTGEAA